MKSNKRDRYNNNEDDNSENKDSGSIKNKKEKIDKNKELSYEEFKSIDFKSYSKKELKEIKDKFGLVKKLNNKTQLYNSINDYLNCNKKIIDEEKNKKRLFTNKSQENIIFNKDIGVIEFLFWNIFRNKVIFQNIFSNFHPNNKFFKYEHLNNINEILENYSNGKEIIRDKIKNGDLIVDSYFKNIYKLFKSNTSENQIFYQQFFKNYFNYINISINETFQIIILENNIVAFKSFIEIFNLNKEIVEYMVQNNQQINENFKQLNNYKIIKMLNYFKASQFTFLSNFNDLKINFKNLFIKNFKLKQLLKLCNYLLNLKNKELTINEQEQELEIEVNFIIYQFTDEQLNNSLIEILNLSENDIFIDENKILINIDKVDDNIYNIILEYLYNYYKLLNFKNNENFEMVINYKQKQSNENFNLNQYHLNNFNYLFNTQNFQSFENKRKFILINFTNQIEIKNSIIYTTNLIGCLKSLLFNNDFETFLVFKEIDQNLLKDYLKYILNSNISNEQLLFLFNNFSTILFENDDSIWQYFQNLTTFEYFEKLIINNNNNNLKLSIDQNFLDNGEIENQFILEILIKIFSNLNNNINNDIYNISNNFKLINLKKLIKNYLKLNKQDIVIQFLKVQPFQEFNINQIVSIEEIENENLKAFELISWIFNSITIEDLIKYNNVFKSNNNNLIDLSIFSSNRYFRVSMKPSEILWFLIYCGRYQDFFQLVQPLPTSKSNLPRSFYFIYKSNKFSKNFLEIIFKFYFENQSNSQKELFEFCFECLLNSSKVGYLPIYKYLIINFQNALIRKSKNTNGIFDTKKLKRLLEVAIQNNRLEISEILLNYVFIEKDEFKSLTNGTGIVYDYLKDKFK